MMGWLTAALVGVLALGSPAPAHSRPVSPLDPSAQFSAESMAENAKNCMFLYQAPQTGTKYVYALKGLQSPGGYYTVVQPVGQVTYTFWFQLCSNMEFSRADPGRPGVACSRKGLENNCPKKCRDERTHTCGNGCSALLAQHLPKAKHSSCWSVGQWGEGTKVSVSLLDPTDPTRGIIYTMLQGDSKGCPAGVSRTLSLAITCPGVGMPTVPVLVATSLGNCAYAATMQHPAACPITQDTLSARDQRLSFYRNTQGAGVGSTGEVFLHLFGAAFSLFLLYMCAGALWRYMQLGMRGVDVIPHMHLWKELPDTVVRFGVAAADEVRTLMDPAHTGVPSEELDAQRGHSSATVPLLRRDQ